MGFVRKGGGGGGGDEGGGDQDELRGDAHKRCAVCRRELLPWQSVCPDDGGAAIEPGELGAPEHDELLRRLLAEDPRLADDDAGGTDGTDGDDDAGGEGGEDAPTWPEGADPSRP